MEELHYLLGSLLILSILGIVWLLASNFELRANCKEWESRTLGLESDITEAKIRAVLQNCRIDDLQTMKDLQLENAISLERENKKLRDQNEEIRIELIELASLQDYESNQEHTEADHHAE